jgi:hypothetical protein
MNRRGEWIGLLGLVLGVAVLFGLWRLTPLRDAVTADAVRQWAGCEAVASRPWCWCEYSPWRHSWS